MADAAALEYQSSCQGYQHFAGIHDAIWIKSCLDPAHQIYCRLTMFLWQVFRLLLAHAMFTSAGAFHRDGACNKSSTELRYRVDFLGIGNVHHWLNMKVTIADMSHYGCDQPRRLHVFGGFGKAVGKT